MEPVMFRQLSLIHRLADLVLGPIARVAMMAADDDAKLVLNPRIAVQERRKASRSR